MDGLRCQGGLSSEVSELISHPNSLGYKGEKDVVLPFICLSASGSREPRVILKVCLDFSTCVFLYTVPSEELLPLALFLSYLFLHFFLSLLFPLQACFPPPLWSLLFLAFPFPAPLPSDSETNRFVPSLFLCVLSVFP